MEKLSSLLIKTKEIIQIYKDISYKNVIKALIMECNLDVFLDLLLKELALVVAIMGMRQGRFNMSSIILW